MKRGEYRSIHTVLTTEQDFKDLTIQAKVLWYTLKLHLGASGIKLLAAHSHQLSDLTNLTVNAVEKAKSELREGQWLYWEGDILWLRNGLKYEPSLTLANSNHLKGVINHLAGLPQQPIVRAFCDYYGLEDVTHGKALAMPLEGHGNGIGEQEEIEGIGSRKPESIDPMGKYLPAFDEAWGDYPKRKGTNSKRDAYRQWVARINSGIRPEDLHTATVGFKTAMESDDKIGTEFIMAGRRFYGANENWVEYLEAELDHQKSLAVQARKTKQIHQEDVDQDTPEAIEERKVTALAAIAQAREILSKPKGTR